MIRKEKKHVFCIFNLEAYGPLLDDTALEFAGSGRQFAIFARELALQGHTVNLITHHRAYDRKVFEHEGIKVLCVRTSRYRYIRRIYPLLYDTVYFLLVQPRSCFCITQGADWKAALIYFICRITGRRFIFWLGSVADADPTLLKEAKGFWTARITTWMMRRLKTVICQTFDQQRLLHKNFGIRGQVIYNGHVDTARETSAAGNYFIWVGRFMPVKRPEILLEIASEMPDIDFVVVNGAWDDIPYNRSMVNRVREVRNIKYYGRLPFVQVNALLRKSLALVNTSVYEGLPNTFIECWNNGVPVLTMGVDPDGLISSRGLGLVASDRHGLKSHIASVMRNSVRFDRPAIRRYSIENFSVGKAYQDLMEVIRRYYD